MKIEELESAPQWLLDAETEGITVGTPEQNRQLLSALKEILSQ